ncbi:MAG TPA: hypothetical protein VFB60_28835 [Ktedonobacteraceae bacterium]|nr:hypothetical protein [Ktedonobacteraceae bacterium]
MPRWLYMLLVFAVLAPVLDFLHLPPIVLFIVAALGIVPLAALIGEAVEDIAEHTGERIGGLLFATFGNATEMIIGIFALSQGLVDVVRASIIGTILGNALLVLGVAICVGSFKHGRLQFPTRPASQYSALLALCVAGLLLPTVAMFLASSSHAALASAHEGELSNFIAMLLLAGYLASILFSVFRVRNRTGGEEDELDPIGSMRSAGALSRLLAYRKHLAQSATPGKSGVLRRLDTAIDAIIEHETGQHGQHITQEKAPSSQEKTDAAPIEAKRDQVPQKEKEEEAMEKPPLWRGLLLLLVATVGVAILSEILVGAIEPMTTILGWNPAFVGLIFVPLIGALPEYFNTISMALDKRIGMVLAASAGSSIQIALLVAPILILASLLMPQHLDLVFSPVELAVLGLATFLFSEITRDGELVWLEGLLLILLYAMMGGTVFLFGS